MQQGQKRETARLENKKGWFVGAILFFSLLLFLSIGFSLYVNTSLWKSTSTDMTEESKYGLMAMMPLSQNHEKVKEKLEEIQEIQKTTESEAVCFLRGTVDFEDSTVVRLILQTYDSNECKLVVGERPTERGILLPYTYASMYGIQTGQSISMILDVVSSEEIHLTVDGFYQDDALGQQSEDCLFAYAGSKIFDDLKENIYAIPYIIFRMQLKEGSDSEQVLDKMDGQMREELFADGLDLEVYDEGNVHETIEIYLSCIRNGIMAFGIFFAMIAALGILRMTKNMRNMQAYSGQAAASAWIEVPVILGIASVIGTILLFAGAKQFVNYLLSGVGRKTTESFLVPWIAALLLFLLIAGLMMWLAVTSVQTTLPQIKAIKKYENLSTKGMLLAFRFQNMAILIVTTVILTGSILAANLYSGVMGTKNLLYQYNDEKTIIEVFQGSAAQSESGMESFLRLIAFTKPMLSVMFYMILGMEAILYILYLYNKLQRRAFKLAAANPNRPLKEQSVKVWISLLILLSMAFALAVVMALILLNPTTVLIQAITKVSLREIGTNLVVDCLLFGLFFILTSGVTVATIR